MNPHVVRFDDSNLPDLIAECLETGKTIVFPTDTVYGIGGNPWDERTLARIRRLKRRPEGEPFTLHLPTVEGIEKFARLNDRLRREVRRLLPGAYTLLLPAREGAPPSAVKEGRVGIRVPDHPFFSEVIARLDRPLFGTSVNRTGEDPINDVAEIIERFSKVDLIITGPVEGSPSAIVDATVDPPRIVGRGSTPGERLEPGDEVA